MADKPFIQVEDISFNYADLLRRLTLSGEELRTQNLLAAVLQELPADPNPPPSGSPGQLQDASSLDSNASGQISLSWGGRSPGKASPFRGRTMKEYEEQLATLKKDNFALKLRIYFLEERMGQKCDRDDKDDLYRTNIELKVETEALKQELYDKQELVRQASTALASLEHHYQDQLAQARHQHGLETEHLNQQIQALQKEVDGYCEQLQQGAQGRLGELTQLCGLAFSTEEGEAALNPPSDPLDLTSYPNPLTAPSPVQGVFSLPSVAPDAAALERSQPTPAAEEGSVVSDYEQQLPGVEEEEEGSEVEKLRERVVELEGRVEELEEELAKRQDTAAVLEEDLANLRKEVEEKVEKIGQLEQEVAEKDEKVEAVMQELELQHSELAAKDHLIQSLHQDLHRVEPEIEVKVQEIVERDRIIEEKIEQIEQQNKILVEIQITLDEKQKQLADMEQKVEEYEQKVAKLTQGMDKSCEVIQTFAEEVHTRDKEIVNLKKELKRKEKKVRDLVAELKETLDMLKKAKWEAETSGGEDGVKEMAEEENEVCFGNMESGIVGGALIPYVNQGRCKDPENEVKSMLVAPHHLQRESENALDLNVRGALEAPPTSAAQGFGERMSRVVGGRNITQNCMYANPDPNCYDGNSCMSLSQTYSMCPLITITHPASSPPTISPPPQNLLLHNTSHHHLMPPSLHSFPRQHFKQQPSLPATQQVPSATSCGGVIHTAFSHRHCCCQPTNIQFS